MSSPLEKPRENWSARSGFILAAAGSAIGLGNIWRFPYVAYENGGGAFLVPYLFALITAGLPLLFLDYAVGHKYRKSPPLAYQQISHKAQSLGWWQVVVNLFIAIYYASVLSWAASYVYFSVGQKWHADPDHFFFQEYLHSNGGTTFSFDFISHLFWPLFGMWAVVLIILYLGVKRGIEWSNKIFMPLLTVLFMILVIQSLRLPGAVVGLNAFFTPDWSAMTNYKVWLAAYGHIFFSLSVGFGIMVTYASYLGRKANLTASALVVGMANSSTEILAGIGVFAALGFMAVSQGVEVKDVASGGIGLAFIAYPKIISSLGAGGDIFGLLFFSSLVFAGITSLVSVMEVPISAIQDKTGCSRHQAVTIVGGSCATISLLLFSTSNAVSLVDIIDHFINNIGVVFGSFMSIILVSWLVRPALDHLIDSVNAHSSIKVGKWWRFFLTFIAPSTLLVALVLSINALFKEGYGDYPSWLVMLFGWGSVFCCLAGAVLLSYLPHKHDKDSGGQS